MKKSTVFLTAILSVSAITTPAPAEAWVWLIAKKLINTSKPTKPVKPEFNKKEFAKPMKKRSENRYKGSDRESRYKRF